MRNAMVQPRAIEAGRARIFAAVAVVATTTLLVGAAAAHAASPWWGLTSGSWPANLPAQGSGKVILTAENRGNAAVDAAVSPVIVRDTLPAGVTAVTAEGVAGESEGMGRYRGALKCAIQAGSEVECRFEGSELPPYEQIEVRITVSTHGVADGALNTVGVEGGGAPEQRLSRPLSVGASTPFGVEQNALVAEEEGGSPATQAGVHPFELTDVLALNTSEVAADPHEEEPAEMTKDLTFQIPPGLIGDPSAIAQCTQSEFTTEPPKGVGGSNECPSQTAIGVASVTFDLPGTYRFDTVKLPLFNLTPLEGEPARFGFDVVGVSIYLNTSVRTGEDYGVTVHVSNIPEIEGYLESKITFWGVPGAAVHADQRGWDCLDELGGGCSPVVEAEPPPFISLPTACTGPMTTSVQADSWAEPHPAHPLEAPLFREAAMPGMDGCNHLQFDPEISVVPDVPDASTPTGLEVKVHVPQSAALNPEGLAEATVRNTTVTLPEGVTLNAGGADGLEACAESGVGWLGHGASEPASNLFTSTLPEPFCPNSAKVGTAEIQTPLLPNALKGDVYLATPAPFGEPDLNPFDSLVAMYIVVQDPVSGTLVKLAGKVVPNPVTGQLVSTFEDTPQLPFENLVLHFFGGGRAPLATPALCGAYTTSASFEPWSFETGSSPSTASSAFQITSGPNGAPCSDPRPFAPEFQAGSTNLQAGAFTPFTLTMGHPDADQVLGGISLSMPPGLSGDLAGIPLCGEPQASTGECPAGSLIGHTVVTAGLGSTPAVVKRAGDIYITGPYKGAPFGLSIVNPAETGPFDLGNVVVRAKIEVNPITAQLTVTSDPLPTILKGVPLNLQHVNVTIDRPGFTFNPTNCSPMQLGGTMSSGEGASAGVSTPFQVTNCASLSFKPGFSVSTSGRPSRLNGTSLDVKLTYPSAPAGTQTNIAKVKVELPKQLPSRLATLQKACTESQFANNPEGCPAASRVGRAYASTPILSGGLSGPAYFVSHGNAAWPELIVVLRGEDGVTVDLHGETFISSKGITSSTFKTVPDVPVGSFELQLPQGRYSALTALGNPCKSALKMPTEFVAQNGLVRHQSTRIAVSGCPKAKAKKSKKAKRHGRGRKSRRARHGKQVRGRGRR